MRLLMAVLCGAVLCAAQTVETVPAAPRPLDLRVDQLLTQFPAVARGAWGAYALNLATGDVLYQRDSNHTFVPASNNKLYATSLALNRLGPDYRFITRVTASQLPNAQGLLAGDLILQGGGDPTLSGREYPYRKNAPVSDPLGPLDELAARIYESGIRRITGDIVGDDRAYLHEPFPPGWGEDDTLYDYGAPVSALVLHDNYLDLRLDAAQPGELAHLRSTPETGYFQVINRVLSTARGASHVSYRRTGDGRVIELSGTVSAASPVSLDVALDDPARYAAHAFRYLLTRRGITVDGVARPLHRTSLDATLPAVPASTTDTIELARRSSPPLAQIVQVTNKVSQNLYAELLLRELARVRGKAGSRRAALDELGTWLRSLGARNDDFAFSDGSGLSRLDLITPETTIRVLKAMYEGPNRDLWLDSLPLGGEDGSLSLRFKGWTGGRVRAKTGTLTHVTALSGYLDTPAGDLIAFSVMANNANTNAAGIRGFIDALVIALAAPPGTPSAPQVPRIVGAETASPQ
ncbi:MAG: D-alanyl-D-alanine carboxypeptidase/D-alanyl-D-alanine-endopeptidase [Acidobacteriota bacterium]